MAVGIILAGGVGNRMHLGIPKQFFKLSEHTVLYQSTINMSTSNNIDSLNIVGDKEYILSMEPSIVKLVNKIIEPGPTRLASLYNGFLNSSLDNMIVNDSARAMITGEVIDAMYPYLNYYDYVAFGHRIVDYICDLQLNPLDRNTFILYSAPELFSRRLVRKIINDITLDEINKFSSTLELVENFVGPRRIKILFFDEYPNIKITYRKDLEIYKRYFNNK